MDKKGQFVGEAPGLGTKVHPVMILGIIIFIIPFFGPVLKMSIPTWVNAIGLILIVIGIILTAIKEISK